MRRMLFIGSVLVILLPVSLTAKGITVKIVIKTDSAVAPLEITEPEVGQFNVWSGPGTFLNDVENFKGFIIDWTGGSAADPPASLPRYEVSFYTGCAPTADAACKSSRPSLSYIVDYVFDPANGEGFVRLPIGDERARLNGQSIYHGRQYYGQWLHATKAWADFVKTRMKSN